MAESTEVPIVTLPAQDAPPEHHEAFWRSLVKALGEAAESPAILALVPVQFRGAVQVAGAVVQLVADPNAAPASLGAT